MTPVPVAARLPAGSFADDPAVGRLLDLLSADGEQAYVVCPLVEDSEQIQARAATAEFERLQAEVFGDLRLGLLHGRMRPAEKDAVMQAFAAGESFKAVALVPAFLVIAFGIMWAMHRSGRAAGQQGGTDTSAGTGR